MKPDQSKGWDPDRPNTHICQLICSLTTSNDHEDSKMAAQSRSELDSHANMVVVGRNAYIIQDTGRRADVSQFTPDYEALNLVPIVDAAMLYSCPFTGEDHILIVHDALYVPSMENNLIPPFVMRAAGVKVSDTPKIHVSNPSIDDHAIYF